MNHYRQYFNSLSKKATFTKVWFLPTLITLGISRIIILTINFRRLAPYLGHPIGIKACTCLISPEQEIRALQISHVIRVASQYSPWIANCFPQAVTARVILGFFNIPYTLYFGLAKDPENKKFIAHAWVTAGKVAVTGGHGFSEYTIVGCYLSKAGYRNISPYHKKQKNRFH
uniref:lasso peptide biosynthesis B2 protein n=1 Tax=uncultured Halomonas sp. TaxID=173971 RepID=UPI00342B0E0B